MFLMFLMALALMEGERERDRERSRKGERRRKGSKMCALCFSNPHGIAHVQLTMHLHSVAGLPSFSLYAHACKMKQGKEKKNTSGDYSPDFGGM